VCIHNVSQYVQYLPTVVGELFCRVWTRRCTMGCWWWLCVSANLPFSWTRNSNSAARMSPQSSRCWRSGLVVARLLHGDARSYPRPTYFCSARFPLLLANSTVADRWAWLVSCVVALNQPRGQHALMLNCRHHRQLWQGITMSSAVWIHFSILLTNRRIPL